MIQLVKGQTSNVVLTLTEKTTLALPNYLFVFTHETTKEVISFVIPGTADLSGYPKRFNEFVIDSSYFLNASVGKYIYQVYEQTDPTNTDTTFTTSMVENGKMDLNAAAPFTFTEYDEATNFKQYGG